MSIVCYSRDTSLIDSLVRRYGREDVVVSSDGIPGGKACKDADIVVVDLRFCLFPGDASVSFPCLVLAVVPKLEEAVKFVQSGVKGYGNRKMLSDNLYLAIESIKAGHLWLPPEILIKLVHLVPAPQDSGPDLLADLSKREREVAGYVARGMSNQEMSEEMFVSLRTVKAHLTSIYDKTGFRNRLELGLHLKEKGIG